MIQEITLILLLYLSSYTATTTAYSPENVDPRWQGQARWTGQPPIVGISVACPVEWRMQWVYIDGYGWRQCQDTPKHGWYDDGSPHVDIFLGSRQEAIIHGIRRMNVWKEK